MTDASPPASGATARAFDAGAQTLAQSLRSARLTVLVGALGVGKSALLVDGVLPLLRRRVGDEPSQGGGPPQGAAKVPDRRRGAQGELLHFVDRWAEPPDEPQAAGRSRFELAEAMSPAHLADVSRRHGGAHLLFVFDHFERLLEGVQRQPQLQRFADAWAEVVQAPDLGVHFLVAIDEPAWPRLQAGFAGMPAVELQAFRLRAGADGLVLEPLRHEGPGAAAAGLEPSHADLAASFNQSLSQVATLAREERQRLRGFAASVDADLSSAYSAAHEAEPPSVPEPNPASRQTPVQGERTRLGDTASAAGPDLVEPARQRDAPAETTARTTAAAAETERRAEAWQRAEARSAREAAARAAEFRHAAQVAAEREAAERTAEAERVAQAQRAAEVAAAAQAEQIAEAARQAEAARRAELRRLEQSLAAAEAAAAREAQARAVAEAASQAAQAQRLAEAQQRAEAERRAEAARQVEAATAAEAQRLAQSLAAAEAAAAREAQARAVAEAASQAAQAQRLAEAQQRAEAERRAEAARQVEAATAAEAQRLAQSLAAAEAAAAREAQARRAAEEASTRRTAELAEATRTQEAERAAALAQQRVLEERATAAAGTPPSETVASEAAAGARVPAPRHLRPARKGLLWGMALLLGAAAAMLWWPTTPTPPRVAGVPMPTPEVGSASAPAPAALPASPSAAERAAAATGDFSVLMASADPGHTRIARELADALSTEGRATRVVSLPEATEPINGLQEPGRLAIVRFDALRAARAGAAPPLRVLTPLYPEAVLFVVRADSPLKYIHELRGRRLSIGPVQSDGAHTVRAIYRHLFGTDMKESERLDNDTALAELVAFRSIDAMAIIEPLPSAWWASLDPGTARRLRLLTLDPRHPADRQLLQAAGTSVARVGTGTPKGTPATTPTVMSFLVVSGEGDADVERLTAMANALCRELPQLRERGHPKWRELQPASKLDTGWPMVQSFRSVVSRCARR